jgi:hypothetical protein
MLTKIPCTNCDAKSVTGSLIPVVKIIKLQSDICKKECSLIPLHYVCNASQIRFILVFKINYNHFIIAKSFETFAKLKNSSLHLA